MKILIVVGILIVAFVFAEVVSVVKLGKSVSTYQKYWENRISDEGEFTYIALGDSAAQAVGASKPELGYVGQIANRIQEKTGKSVRIVNLSVSGAKIDDVINEQLPKLKDYKPSLITIEIGANEMKDYNSDSFSQKYSKLTKLLPKNTVVSDIPNFGGRVRRPNETADASTIIAQLAKENSLELASLHQATKDNESLLNYSADFFHPNERGYKIWADAFWQKIEPWL